MFPIAGVLAAMLAAPSSAGAQSAAVVVDDPSPTGPAELAGPAAAAVRRLGWTVVTAEIHARQLAVCLDEKNEECMQEMIGAAGADAAVLLRVHREKDGEGEPMIRLSGHILDARLGPGAADQRFCERCTSQERLDKLVDELVVGIVRRHWLQMAPDTSLEVRATPDGAEVTVDGQGLGRAGRAYPVSPGPHVVEVTASGYQPHREDVTLRPNERRALDVTLRRGAAGGGKRPRFHRWKWIALGSGVVATGLGITYILIDMPAVDGGMEQPRTRETLVPGILLTGAGAALITTGILMWRADKREQQAVSASAAPLPGGAMLTVGGRF